MKYMNDADGKWQVEGPVRILVEPSADYLARLHAIRDARKTIDEEAAIEAETRRLIAADYRKRAIDNIKGEPDRER